MKIPPVVLLSGSNEYLRVRKLREITFKYESGGWVVDDLQGPDEMHNYLGGFAAMFDEKRVALLNSTADFDTDLVMGFGKDPDPQLGFIICYPGTPKAKSAFKKLAKTFAKTYMNYPAPERYKEAEAAAAFCISEAKARGVTISSGLAAALIDRVGDDFGIVSFEVFKAVELARSLGVVEITSEILKGSMAVTSEALVWPLVDALAARNQKAVAVILGRLAATKAKPTMQILGMLRSTILEWAQAAELHERGVPPKDAATILKMNPWRYEQKVLPRARYWGKRRMFGLVQKFAIAERAVLSGAIDPWNVFVSGILSTL